MLAYGSWTQRTVISSAISDLGSFGWFLGISVVLWLFHDIALV